MSCLLQSADGGGAGRRTDAGGEDLAFDRPPARWDMPSESDTFSAEEEGVAAKVLALLKNEADVLEVLESEMALRLLRRLVRGFWSEAAYGAGARREARIAEECRKIATWRRAHDMETCLSRRPPNEKDAQEEAILRAWPCVYHGRDRYGHPLVSEHYGAIDWKAFDAFDLEAVVIPARACCIELMTLKKLAVQRHEIHKQITVIDLDSISLVGLLTSPRRLKKLRKVLEWNECILCDTVWKTYIVRAPKAARLPRPSFLARPVD